MKKKTRTTKRTQALGLSYTKQNVGLQKLMNKSMPHISIEEVVTGQQKTQRLPLITAHLSTEREFSNLTLLTEAERSKKTQED